jgi:hypothetical protein
MNKEIDMKYSPIVQADKAQKKSVNSSSIGTRYTKTQAYANFVSSSDAKLTGELNIRAQETDDYSTLTSMLSGKVDNSTLTSSYTTTTNMNTALDIKFCIHILIRISTESKSFIYWDIDRRGW